MKVDFDDSITQGTKWDILSALAYQDLSPKQLAEKTWTTMGNVSQHLKILEAYGYVKKAKKDKGKGSRKNPDTRIKYSLVKNKSWLISLGFENVMKKEIKHDSLTNNILGLDSKFNLHFFKLFLNSDELLDSDFVCFLKGDGKEVNLLVVNENPDPFRKASSANIKIKNEEIIFRFWSHTSNEIVEGLKRKETYFEAFRNCHLLIEKSPGLMKRVCGYKHE